MSHLPTVDHEVWRKPGQLGYHVTHAPWRRPDAQLITLALDDQVDVPSAVSQFSRDAHGLGIAVLEDFGGGHGKTVECVRVHLTLTLAVRQPTRPRWPTFDEAALLAGATNTERANIERILPHKLALQADYRWRSTKPTPIWRVRCGRWSRWR